MTLAPALGAPGILVVPPEPVRELTGVRRDVAAFLGVAPRGPAWLPPATLAPDDDVAGWLATTRRRRSVAVAVSSWDEYRRLFGGFEGPGRLPYAVSAFFAAGGVRAYVVRVVHEHADRVADAAGRSSGTLFAGAAEVATTGGDPLLLHARTEGRWGDALRVAVRFTSRPLPVVVDDPSHLVVASRDWVPGGTLLRLSGPGDVQELQYVDSSVVEPEPAGPGSRRVLTLGAPAGVVPDVVEVVEARVEVVDHDRSFARRETLDAVGLRADHPRWLARVLVTESELLWPDLSWAAGTVVLPDPALPSLVLRSDDGDHLGGGRDLWSTITPEDFWDAGWVPGDEDPGDGVQCLGEVDDVGLVVAPDLYEPEPLAPVDDVTDLPTFCGPDFEVHVEQPDPPPPEAPPAPGLDGLALDPRVPAELARIMLNQAALVAFADQRRDHTLLLDVPLGLTHREILAWRAAFDSPQVAAYHPWLDVARPDDQRDTLIRVNPAAFAAGIIAERERRLGVQHGPAGEVAVGALRLADVVTPAAHDELHPDGINVFAQDAAGIRLSGARTLSRRAPLRQLSVARLLTVLRLTLEREMRWAVFEPNGPALWAEVRRLVHGLLTRLFEAGAFTGATTKESFFVTCDRTTMTQNDLDRGRLVCLVGVAPAEPVEYIVLEMALAATTGVRVEVRG